MGCMFIKSWAGCWSGGLEQEGLLYQVEIEIEYITVGAGDLS